MNKITSIILIVLFGAFTSIALANGAPVVSVKGVFTKVAEPSETSSGIIFKDAETSTTHYVLKELSKKVIPYLNQPVKLKAKIRATPNKKAKMVVWIMDIAKDTSAVSQPAPAAPASKKPAPADSGEVWKDKYFKKHPEADTNKDGTLTWPEYKKHKNAA